MSFDKSLYKNSSLPFVRIVIRSVHSFTVANAIRPTSTIAISPAKRSKTKFHLVNTKVPVCYSSTAAHPELTIKLHMRRYGVASLSFYRMHIM